MICSHVILHEKDLSSSGIINMTLDSSIYYTVAGWLQDGLSMSDTA